MKLKTVLLASASVLAMTSHAHALEAIGSLIISTFLSVGAGSLLPVASAAAIGLGAVSTALTAANLAFSFLNRPKANPQELKQTSKGQETSGRHAFGRVLLAGDIGFGNTAGYEIYRLLFQCFGPIDGIEDYIYDGRSITVESNGDVSSPPWAKPAGSYLNIQTKPGAADTAFGDLVGAFPSLITSAFRSRGVAKLLLKATNPGTGSELFPTLFQGGIKEAKTVARAGLFYDPRTTTSSWTMNGPLICLHYFRKLPGMQDAFIDFADIGEVATAAEVMVATKDGTAPRSQLSGGWRGPITYDKVLDMLESAGLQWRMTQEGKFTFDWLEDDPASEATFYKRHVLASYPQAGPEGVKRPNVCKLKYFCPTRGYDLAEIDLSDAPWARVQSEIDKYGEQELTIDLVFCPDPSQAQRNARRIFHMARADFGLTVTNFSGIASFRRKTITIEVPDIGTDGASAFLKVRKGSARIYDGEGRCEIPWQLIPAELQVPWNPATMEVDPPPPLPEFEYESDLDKPAVPTYAQVQYPGGAYELRIAFLQVPDGITAEATYRTYAAGVPELWTGMTEYVSEVAPNQFYAHVPVNAVGKDADFRVRFFNAELEASYWSDLREVRPVAIGNAAPNLRNDEITGNYGTYSNVLTTSLNAAFATLRVRQYTGGSYGPYTTVDTADIRPGEAVTLTDPNPPVPPSLFDRVEYSVRVHTTNGTASVPYVREYIDTGA